MKAIFRHFQCALLDIQPPHIFITCFHNIIIMFHNIYKKGMLSKKRAKNDPNYVIFYINILNGSQYAVHHIDRLR